MSEEALTKFARDLAAEVEESILTGDHSIYSEQEFTRIVLDRLGDEGAIENPVVLWHEGVFEGTKYKITGYASSDEDERILLATTVYTGELPPRTLTREEIMNAIQQAIKFYEFSCKGLSNKIDPSHTDASDLARRIYEFRERTDVLRIILISDGLASFPAVDLKEAIGGARLILDIFGIEQLHRILGEGVTRDDIFLDLQKECGNCLPCLKASTTDADYDAYLTALPGAVLAGVYEKYGTRLLELNVRAFLGVRGRKTVNAGLRRTILEEPNRFLAYNNGIVATVDHIDLETDSGGNLGIRALRGLQIVNGGQTTASLHRSKKQDHANLDGIMVPTKIIIVRGENLNEMVAAVSRSANSQNTVQPADFSSNDPFHVAVEELTNNTWLPSGEGRWFYERARGSYGAAELKASFRVTEKRRFASETPKDRRFSKTDMAKYLNAWDGQPHLVSQGNQKNFQHLMQSLKEEYPDGFKPDATWFKAFIAKAIIFRAVQSIVREKKFPAYQANITAYTVAYLAAKTGGQIDVDEIWSRQAISSELRVMLADWTTEIDKALRQSSGGRMPSEWAKKAECWNAIQKIALKPPEQLPVEVQHIISSAVGRQGGNIVRTDAVSRDVLDSPETPEELHRNELIVGIRHLFNGGGVRSRDEAIAELAKQSGSDISDSKIKEELDNVLRTAVRRGILAHKGTGLAVSGRNIADYDRDFLKDQFLASMQGRSWTEREDSIRMFARWLGFGRTGSYIDETARSIINGLIREDRLESQGSQIRRL